MSMQESEQGQPSGQEWQANQQYGQVGRDKSGPYYQGGYESEQQEKIYPQEERGMHGTGLVLLAMIILSSIGFFLTVAGIVGSAIVLRYANGQQAILAGGVIGLVSSIIVMLVCVAIFVIAVVAMAIRTRRGHRGIRN